MKPGFGSMVRHNASTYNLHVHPFLWLGTWVWVQALVFLVAVAHRYSCTVGALDWIVFLVHFVAAALCIQKIYLFS